MGVSRLGDTVEVMRALKFTLIPTKDQEQHLRNASGAARWAYNYALEMKDNYYKEYGKNLKEGDIRKTITALKKKEEYKWLYEVSAQIPKQAVRDLDRAFQNFFNGNARHPRFKAKGKCREGFYTERIRFERRNNRIYVKIEKLKDLILISKEATKYKNIEKARGVFLNPRIHFNGKRWELSFSIKLTLPKKELTDEVLGVDLGVAHTAICSDGDVFDNINKTSDNIKKLERRKKRIQRKISKKYDMNKEGNKFIKTNNIRKEEEKLLKLNNRLTNIRRDYTHKVSRAIVDKKPQVIVMEDLNIRGMMKNRHLSKAIQQQNLNRLVGYIKYKAESQGTVFIQAKRNFKSTQLCSTCGNSYRIKLNERVYKCNSCGLSLDRDLNAALNLKNYGLTQLKSQA